jgi:hypothetical protein
MITSASLLSGFLGINYNLKYEGSLQSSWTYLITPRQCGQGFFSEVTPMSSDAFLTTVHPFLENGVIVVLKEPFL